VTIRAISATTCTARPSSGHSHTVEVISDQAAAYLRVIDELAPAALHVTERHSNNRIEADLCRLRARLHPMRD
jgi:transposase, IS6 family